MTTMTFANLKKSSNSANSLERLSEQLAKITAPSFTADDDRFWYPETDKAGNGYAVIRFLDAAQGEDVPFVRLWDHRFKGPTGSWYIEKCLTTIGKQDPVAEHNNVLWNSGQESDKALARERKRQLYFISNILVLKDPMKPENDGKVFLFRYGKKIYDKLNDQLNPAAGEDRVNPFNFWRGANFKMKIRTVEGFRNYDNSNFDPPTPLSPDDSVIEQIWNQEHALQPFIDEKNFKPYDELKAKLDRVLGTNKPQPRIVEVEPTSKVVPFGEHNGDDGAAVEHDDPEEESESFANRVRLFEQMKKDSH